MLIHVRSSKTLRHQEYVLELPVYYTSEVSLCAATSIKYLLDHFPCDEDGPLFLKKGRSTLVPVVYSDLLHFIKDELLE